MARRESNPMVGPGRSCTYCGEGYGGHTADCPAPRQEKLRQDKADKAFGKKFREALKKNDDLKLGRLLRELVEDD